MNAQGDVCVDTPETRRQEDGRGRGEQENRQRRRGGEVGQAGGGEGRIFRRRMSHLEIQREKL